jgi:hypothetical protein
MDIKKAIGAANTWFWSITFLLVVLFMIYFFSSWFEELLILNFGYEPPDYTWGETFLMAIWIATCMLVYQLHKRLDHIEHSITRLHERLDLIIFKDDDYD